MDGINKWVTEGVGDGPYAGGQAPNFADVCVFGCLKAIDRTKAWQEIMADTQIAPWCARMRSPAADFARPPSDFASTALWQVWADARGGGAGQRVHQPAVSVRLERDASRGIEKARHAK